MRTTFWITLATAVVLGASCNGELEVDDPPAPDHLELLFDRVEDLDPQLADSVRALPDVADGVDDDELAALGELVEVLEAVAEEDERFLPLLRSAWAVGFGGEEDAPAVDGDAGDWTGRPTVTDGEADIPAGIDLQWAGATVAGDELFWIVSTLGPMSDTALVVLNLDLGDGSLHTRQIACYLFDGEPGCVAYDWLGPPLDADWAEATPPAWVDLVVEGDTAELVLPLDGVLGGADTPAHLRIQPMIYDYETLEYDYGPYLSLRHEAIHGPVLELWQLARDADPTVAPGLAVATALAEAPLRQLVEPGLRDTVRADGTAMFHEGVALGVDQQSPWQQLFWAWRGLEIVEFGAIPLSKLHRPLDSEGYEFDILTAQGMTWWADLAADEGLVRSSVEQTVADVDDWVWSNLQYRTGYDAMSYFCEDGFLDPETCAAWEQELANGEDYLGQVMDEDLYYYDAMSPSYQRGLWEERGTFYGDCGTHTTITITILKSLGIVTASGQYYSDYDELTHNFPVYFDPEVELWTAYQLPCWPQHADIDAKFFFLLPPRDFLDFISTEYASDVQCTGGWQSYDTMTFGELCEVLSTGLTTGEMVELLYERWWVD
jgi:hypothetical protein